jgi:hypothetical protein
MENEILDEPSLDNRDTPLWQMIAWWEQKRLWYNLMLIVLELVICVYCYEVLLHRFGTIAAIFLSFCYTIAANAFYCMGWGVEILAYYYFPKLFPIGRLSHIFLFLGLLFSICLTASLYLAALTFSHF